MSPSSGQRPPVPFQGTAVRVDAEWAKVDFLTAEADEQIAEWTRPEKALYAELLEDAGSELQREVLLRAVAAGNRPAEVHAFADVIRPLNDSEVFTASSLDPQRAGRESLEDRLWAEADPIYAYLLNGYRLTPRGEASPLSFGPARPLPERRPAKVPPGLQMEAPPPAVVPPKKPAFDAVDDHEVSYRRVDKHDLGVSKPIAPPPPPRAGRFAEELFNEACKALGVSFLEQAVDGEGIPLEKALPAAAEALLRGLPVPVVLGPRAGEFRRYALLLQLQITAEARAFQIYDLMEQETVWANEGDLLARNELPLSDKANRRITAIALPRLTGSGGAAGPGGGSSFQGG